MAKVNREKWAGTIAKTLGIVGAGGLVVATVVGPGVLVTLATLLANEAKLPRRKVYHILRHAKRSGWMRFVETRQGVAIELTEKGKRQLRFLHLYLPLHDKEWDGKWRLVVFDIPDRKRIARDTLRRALKHLGFYQLQESVWVTPYECQEEIEAARTLYGLGANLKLIVADEIDGERELLTRWGLTHRDVLAA